MLVEIRIALTRILSERALRSTIGCKSVGDFATGWHAQWPGASRARDSRGRP